MSRTRHARPRRDPQFEERLHPGTLVEGHLRSHEDTEERRPPKDLTEWFGSRRTDASFPPEICAEADRVFPYMSRVLQPASCGPMAIQRRGGFFDTTVLVGDRAYEEQDPGDPFAGASDVWMSDSLVERVECLPVVRAAHGDVLILGLGMGLIPLAICATRAQVVRRIEIVEACTEIIMLVWPTLCWARRQITRLTGVDVPIVLYESDAREWNRTIHYDTIWADIWAGKEPHPARMAEHKEMEKKMRRMLSPGGWYGAWFEPALRRRLADPSWPTADLRRTSLAEGNRIAEEMAMACIAPGAYPEPDHDAVERWRAHLALSLEARMARLAEEAKKKGKKVEGTRIRQADGRWEALLEIPTQNYGPTGHGGSARAAVADLEIQFACSTRIEAEERRSSPLGWSGMDSVFGMG